LLAITGLPNSRSIRPSTGAICMPAQLIKSPSQSVSRSVRASSIQRCAGMPACATGSSHGRPAWAATLSLCAPKKSISAATTSGTYGVMSANLRNPAADNAATTASMVVVERIPVAACTRRLIDSAPATMLAAVQFSAMRLTRASARSLAWTSISLTSAASSSSRAFRKLSRVVMNWTPAGAMICGS
jgi:hypothetical protein